MFAQRRAFVITPAGATCCANRSTAFRKPAVDTCLSFARNPRPAAIPDRGPRFDARSRCVKRDGVHRIRRRTGRRRPSACGTAHRPWPRPLRAILYPTPAAKPSPLCPLRASRVLSQGDRRRLRAVRCRAYPPGSPWQHRSRAIDLSDCLNLASPSPEASPTARGTTELPRKMVYGQMTMSSDLHACFIPNWKSPLDRGLPPRGQHFAKTSAWRSHWPPPLPEVRRNPGRWSRRSRMDA